MSNILKSLTTALLITFIFYGCGSNKSDLEPESDNRDSVNYKADRIGKIDGDYNLWEYITPPSNRVNSFLEIAEDQNSRYKTTYTVSQDSVIEESDYAKDEKIVYKKNRDHIKVTFKRYDIENGSYNLNLTADIGDMITLEESTCILKAHYNSIKIKNQTFNDTIEISCNGKPGYYSKGIGEVAQVDQIASTGSKNIRVLSN